MFCRCTIIWFACNVHGLELDVPCGIPCRNSQVGTYVSCACRLWLLIWLTTVVLSDAQPDLSHWVRMLRELDSWCVGSSETLTKHLEPLYLCCALRKIPWIHTPVLHLRFEGDLNFQLYTNSHCKAWNAACPKVITSLFILEYLSWDIWGS